MYWCTYYNLHFFRGLAQNLKNKKHKFEFHARYIFVFCGIFGGNLKFKILLIKNKFPTALICVKKNVVDITIAQVHIYNLIN